jgi:hypothetical protein
VRLQRARTRIPPGMTRDLESATFRRLTERQMLYIVGEQLGPNFARPANN